MDERSLKCGILFVMTILLLDKLPLVVSKPDGPPQAACSSMRTGTEQGAFSLIGHTGLPQNAYYDNKSPYYIHILNANVSYQHEQEIMVGVVANQTTGRRRFKGVMMQAYRVNCATPDRSTIMVEGRPIGEFYQIGTSRDSLLAPMTCNGDDGNTLAHTSPQWKINETAIWKVPGGLGGHVVFRATIVQDVNIFWTEQHSRILRDPRGGDVPKCGAATYSINSVLLITGGAALLAFKF